MEKDIKKAIEVKDMTIAYHDKPVVWDVDFDVPQGVMMAIVGPNGAGKSTLIKGFMGLVPVTSGLISVFGETYSKNRKMVSYVPQRTEVDWDFPTSVLDVVLMGTYGRLGWIKRPRKEQYREAMEALEKVSMEDFAHRQISQLSGGQQQRVFLARALTQKSEIYLMDEPFQGVDATTEKAIIRILKELKESGKTVLAVHHDLQTVPDYFDWLALLNVRLIALGKVDDIFTEENLRKTYGGRISFMEDQRGNSKYSPDSIMLGVE